MVTLDQQTLQALRTAAGAVPDPEIPVLSIAELGILRDVRVADDGHPEVVLTPTYSGCPATEAIQQDVLATARTIDPDAQVVIELAPAWTTDWITETGRRKLAEYGIAPPRPTRSGPVPVQLGRRPEQPEQPVRCPRCDSPNTELISRFGSTPCKALRRCLACAEPFDEFKSL
jgi:ring-1,2-phenylacetyl-CoA epoxidase subunit PaaD